MCMTEDNVRNIIGNKMKLVDSDSKSINNKNYYSGVGQITTFNEIGKTIGIKEFAGITDKPDGWYLPTSKSEPAIIIECKSESNGVRKQSYVDELFKNIDIVSKIYSHTIGILSSGNDIRIFFDKIEKTDLSKTIEDKDYYISKYKAKRIDKAKLFNLTSKINDKMHFKLGISDLYDRMIFTSCSLASVKEGANISTVENYSELKLKVKNKLEDIFKDKKTKVIPSKFQILIDIFEKIDCTAPTPDDLIVKDLCEWVIEIANNITLDNWNGEDVMSIFFREFNRYKTKSEKGQVFTPENWASFMYRILEINSDCIVIDPTVGSGTFLTTAMAKMFEEIGGPSAAKSELIRNERLFGIEFDKRVYALCIANMIIHKDGMSNIEHMDSLTPEAGNWIKETCKKAVSNGLKVKILMNPPYEQKYGCLKIVKNTLDNVPQGTLAAVIMPDKKLEKDSGNAKKILEKHTLRKIIKMPENVFDAGVTTSIFVFEAGRKHEKDDEIFACYIEDDGLETVKNQGRQDIKGKWQAIEDFWVPIVKSERSSDAEIQSKNIQYFTASERLSYKMPEKPFEIYEEDFVKTMMDYEMYERDIDVKDFNEKLLQKVLYGSEVNNDENGTSISMKGKE